MAQKDPEPLERLQRLFGGRVTLESRIRGTGSRAYRMARWTLSGARARGFLFTIFIELSRRRKKQVRGALTIGGALG